MSAFSRISYTGSTPGTDANTYVLFATFQATSNAQWPQDAFALFGMRKFALDLKHSHGGTLNAYKSSDRGVNWRQVSTEVIAAPAATAGTQREFLVEGVQDWKLEWVNGGTAQSPWVIDMSMSDQRAFGS